MIELRMRMVHTRAEVMSQFEVQRPALACANRASLRATLRIMPRGPDINQLAKRLVDQATGEAPRVDAKKQAAGRKGGAKGGKVRMAALTEEQRAALSAKGVAARKKAPAKTGASITAK